LSRQEAPRDHSANCIDSTIVVYETKFEQVDEHKICRPSPFKAQSHQRGPGLAIEIARCEGKERFAFSSFGTGENGELSGALAVFPDERLHIDARGEGMAIAGDLHAARPLLARMLNSLSHLEQTAQSQPPPA
jgi:hypothetical protein